MYGVAESFVGIDLAWGDRARTGIAVVDNEGALLLTESVRTDEEIHQAISPFVVGPCVVAFDAPLLVRNSTGQRDCERRLSRAFRRYDAGTHPTNKKTLHFADGGRAARLARRYDLEVDATVASSPGQRRALEVYPHS